MARFSRAVALALALVACAPRAPDPCTRLKQVDTGVARHTASCADPACGDGENPPTGGLHCGRWLPCRSYDAPQQRCEWLHNLEHGHLVLAYRCPQGCPELVAALEALRDELPKGSNGVRRALLTPDPLLPQRVAAMVWGWSWSGDEVDPDAIRCLFTKQDTATYEYTDCAP